MFGCIAAGRPVQTDIIAVSETQFTFVLPPSAIPFNHLVIFLLPNNILPPNTAASVYIQLSPTRPFRLLGAIANDKPSAIFRIKGLSSAPQNSTTDIDEMTDDTNPSSSGTINNNNNNSNNNTISQTEPITLGISIEPIDIVQAALSTIPNPSRPSTPALFPSASSSSLSSLMQGTVSTATTPLTLVRAGQQYPNPSSAMVVGSSSAGTIPPIQTLNIARKIIKNAFNYLSSFGMVVPGVQGDVVPLRSFQDWWVKFEKKIEYDPGFLEREES